MGTGGSFVAIDFCDSGNSAYFRRDGWSQQEPRTVWACGPRASLRVALQAAGRAAVMEAEIDPFRAPPWVSGQIVRIRVNDTDACEAHVTERTMIRCHLDPEMLRPDGMIDIEFLFPSFTVPAFMRFGEDTRPLAAAFAFVRFYTLDMFRPGPAFPPSDPGIPVMELARPAARQRVATRPPSEPHILTFGTAGSAKPWLRKGWSAGEPDMTWTVAPQAEMELPAPRHSGPHVLRFDVTPMVEPAKHPVQRVTILLNRFVIGQVTCAEPGSWVVPLPAGLTPGGSRLPLTFLLPDAVRPADITDSPDIRLLALAFSQIGLHPLPPGLGFIENLRAHEAGPAPQAVLSSRFLDERAADLPAAIERTLGMTPAVLPRGFESLGNNCEFGVVQRKLGLDVMNLFRFCNAPFADLVRALADDLRTLLDPAAATLEVHEGGLREYVMSVPAYNIRWHTFTPVDTSDADDVLNKHRVRLAYLRRKFFEGLRGGRKIYVVKRAEPISAAQLAALAMELGRHGPRTLLCVEPAAGQRRPGEVEYLGQGLMRGYVTRFAPEALVHDADPTDWLRVMANVIMLQREMHPLDDELAEAA